jgi:hypothetical protein
METREIKARFGLGIGEELFVISVEVHLAYHPFFFAVYICGLPSALSR